MAEVEAEAVAASAPETPPSEAELAESVDAPQRAAGKPTRDPTLAIILIAIILGVAGVATLFALFLW